jgi:hypothetical protein
MTGRMIVSHFLKLTFGIVLICCMVSCGVAYESRKNELLRTAKLEDYGPRPPENHKEMEKEIILSYLKDPYSAQFSSWAEAQPNVMPETDFSPNPKLVWVTSVQVNAKNSYGGYTGDNTWAFAWSNGKIIAIGSPRTTPRGTTYTSWSYVR